HLAAEEQIVAAESLRVIRDDDDHPTPVGGDDDVRLSMRGVHRGRQQLHRSPRIAAALGVIDLVRAGARRREEQITVARFRRVAISGGGIHWFRQHYRLAPTLPAPIDEPDVKVAWARSGAVRRE